MKSIVRRFALFVIAAVLVAAVGTLVPRPFIKPAMSGTPSRTIYFIANAIHTDIAIPLDDYTRKRFAFVGKDGLPIDNPNAAWMIVGWGGRSFYIETPTWADIKPRPVLRALTADRAALHVELASDLDVTNPALQEFQISQTAHALLLDEILSSFTLGDTQAPILIAGAAYGNFDNFYEANGWFNALIGCNTWAARMARAVGLRSGLWNPLPQSLRFSLDLYN